MTVLATLPLDKPHASSIVGSFVGRTLRKRESVVFHSELFQYQIELLHCPPAQEPQLQARVKARIITVGDGYRLVVEGVSLADEDVEPEDRNAGYEIFYDNGSSLLPSRQKVGERYRDTLEIAMRWLARECGLEDLESVSAMK